MSEVVESLIDRYSLPEIQAATLDTCAELLERPQNRPRGLPTDRDYWSTGVLETAGETIIDAHTHGYWAKYPLIATRIDAELARQAAGPKRLGGAKLVSVIRELQRLVFDPGNSRTMKCSFEMDAKLLRYMAPRLRVVEVKGLLDPDDGAGRKKTKWSQVHTLLDNEVDADGWDVAQRQSKAKAWNELYAETPGWNRLTTEKLGQLIRDRRESAD